VFAGVNVALVFNKVGVSPNALVVMRIAGFTCTAPTTNVQIISNVVVDAAFRPSVAVYLPIRIKKLNVNQMGTLLIFTAGNIGISDVAVTANFWTIGDTNCGIPTDLCVSYII
jgi:hypothetical protein